MQKQKEAKSFDKDFLFFRLDSANRRIYKIDCYENSLRSFDEFASETLNDKKVVDSARLETRFVQI